MRLTRWMAIAGTVTCMAALGACGEEEDRPTGSPGAPTSGTPTPAAEGQQGGDTGDAKAQFAQTCGGCHTLQAAETTGSVGPNLDELKPDRERVLTAIESGPSSMPENLLEGPDAESVADFVAENAGG